MGNRFSIEKAEWTIEREEYYKKECFNMAFEHKEKLIVENDTVFLLYENQKNSIPMPNRDRSFWFETWTYLKGHYASR